MNAMNNNNVGHWLSSRVKLTISYSISSKAQYSIVYATAIINTIICRILHHV